MFTSGTAVSLQIKFFFLLVFLMQCESQLYFRTCGNQLTYTTETIFIVRRYDCKTAEKEVLKRQPYSQGFKF